MIHKTCPRSPACSFLPVLVLSATATAAAAGLVSGCGSEGPERVSLEERQVDPVVVRISLEGWREGVIAGQPPALVRAFGEDPLQVMLRAAPGPMEASPSSLPGALETRADDLLAELAATLGTGAGTEWRRARHRVTPGGPVLTYDRFEQGVRVFEGELVLAFDRSERFLLLRHSLPLVVPAARARLDSRAALGLAQEALGEGFRAADGIESELVLVAPGKGFEGRRLAWRLLLRSAPDAAPALREVFVDAVSGELVRRIDRLLHAGAACVPCDASTDTDCASIFFENPVDFLDDASVRSSQSLDTVQQGCLLSNLTSTNRLTGTWVSTSLTSGRASPPYDALRSANAGQMQEATAYFHLDRAKGYLDALGFTGVMAYALPVDAHDTGNFAQNNAYYDPATREIHLGVGANIPGYSDPVDAAEDPDVVIHEYGHAIQDDQLPGFGAQWEGGAMGEGFGDYWAAALTEDSTIPLLGQPCMSSFFATIWNPYSGAAGTGCLRRMDGTKSFPADFVWEVHDDGEMWASATWALRGTLGGATTDALVLQSHSYLTVDALFVDGGDALLTADQALNGGANAAAIHQAMKARGLPRSAAAPTTVGMTETAAFACETRHNYRNDEYVECRHTVPGADRIRFHFTRFDTEADWDRVYISDADFLQVEVLEGALFGGGAGSSAPVNGDTIVARFKPDASVRGWGFEIDSVSYSIAGCSVDADCDDGLFCNGDETCGSGGACLAGTAPTVDDGVACTTDSCDEAADAVVHAPSNAACDDGLFCNGAELCDATLDCQPGPVPALDDGVACTTDSCDEASQTVTHTPQNSACDDGAFCNGSETCDLTLDCLAGTAPDADDGVACTTDSCDETSDTFVHTPQDAACDDGLFCNGAEICDATLDCQPGTAPSVSDGVGCTTDSCDEAADAVVHAPSNAACDDGAFCNGAEVCDPVADCQAGEAPSCDDADACTIDLCDPIGDACTHLEQDTAECQPTDGGFDGGSDQDGGSDPDAGPVTDAGDGDTGAEGRGCSCAAPGAPSVAGWWLAAWFALALPLTRRRG